MQMSCGCRKSGLLMKKARASTVARSAEDGFGRLLLLLRRRLPMRCPRPLRSLCLWGSSLEMAGPWSYDVPRRCVYGLGLGWPVQPQQMRQITMLRCCVCPGERGYEAVCPECVDGGQLFCHRCKGRTLQVRIDPQLRSNEVRQLVGTFSGATIVLDLEA